LSRIVGTDGSIRRVGYGVDVSETKVKFGLAVDQVEPGTGRAGSGDHKSRGHLRSIREGNGDPITAA